MTREQIVAEAAALFNSRGFAGAPLSELMKTTGLKKGGIYNHFQSKEEILIAAFQYSVALLLGKVREVLEPEPTARGKLKAILEFYRDYPLNPVIKGGCPLLNSIVDADNTNPQLREHVQRAVDQLIHWLRGIVIEGVRGGEFSRDVDPKKAATIILTTIEGGIAVSRNAHDNSYMETIIDYLHGYVDESLSS